MIQLTNLINANPCLRGDQSLSPDQKLAALLLSWDKFVDPTLASLHVVVLLAIWIRFAVDGPRHALRLSVLVPHP